jgi:hypothetical protein
MLPVGRSFQDLQYLIHAFLNDAVVIRIDGTFACGCFAVCNDGFDNELFNFYSHVFTV